MRTRAKALAISVLISGLTSLASAQLPRVETITADCIGFPVPQPVDSLTPVAAVRSYESLRMRYDDLWLAHGRIERRKVGESFHGREMFAYRFSQDGDFTPEGALKSAAVVEGNIHPHEWLAAEGVAAVFEWLALDAATDSVTRYILENSVVVISPLANPDGLIQTQRYFDTLVVDFERNDGACADGWDGRQHRKNMRDVDEVLETFDDYRVGVNLNQNHRPGFGNGSGAGDPLSSGYPGESPGSEPESQALYAAADFAQINGADRIRFYSDIHAPGPLLYIVKDGRAARDAVEDQVARRMVAGLGYPLQLGINLAVGPEPIGTTAGYFLVTYGCVSYTPELGRGRFPGSRAVMMPDAEVPEDRQEGLAMIRTGLYHMAGPPVLIEVAIYHEADRDGPAPDPVYHERRQFNALSETREQSVLENGILAQGRRYLAVLRFNKPMRIQNPDTGEVDALPGQAALPPFVELGSVTGTEATWVFNEGPFGHGRYPGDTLLVTLDLSSPEVCPGEFPLEIFAADLTQGLLDSNPLTVVDWSPEGWVNYEDTAGDPGISGGTDVLTRLTIENPLVTGDCEPNSLLPWIAVDVGEPNFAGITRRGDEDFQVISGGRPFAGGTDTFHLVYQEFPGDTVITARVAGLAPEDATSSIGLTLRASLDPDARHATILLANTESTRHMEFVHRRSLFTRTTPSGEIPDTWVRIERQGNEFIGYHSDNGIFWSELDRETIDLPEVILGGVAVTAINTAGNDVVFAEVSNLYIDEPPDPRYIRGDGNGDGRVNIADPSFIAGTIFGLSVAPITCEAAADANGDGGVNIADPTYIANFLFGIAPATAPPAPFPDCALVPPEETLSCLGTEGCLD